MEHSLFEQLLLILVAAVVATTVFRRLSLPPILAYLSIGALIGPYALGYSEPEHMALMSELGVVFLLFMLGLEFSIPKLVAMRHTVLGLGSLQVIATTLCLIAIGMSFGLNLASAIVVSGALALSSTAIVTKELLRINQLSEPHGQLSFGILLFQDLAAVVFLIIVPTLGQGPGGTSSDPLWQALLEGAAMLLTLMFLGRTLLPALFHEIGQARSDELFVLVALVTALAAAWLTHAAGLSMALGGFLAGMMLGESHFRHQLESDIRPFRDVLLGLFFVTVGMQLNLNVVINNWYWILLLTAVLILLKTTLIALLAGKLRGDYQTALRAGLSLAQGGEFGFALLALALGHQVIDDKLNALVMSTIIFSMIATPILIGFNQKIADRLFNTTRSQPTEDAVRSVEENSAQFHQLKGHIVICGFGRVGQILARFLTKTRQPYVAIDSDPVRIQEAALAGEPAYYGDASRLDILRAIGADKARLVILTLPNAQASLRVLQSIKREFPELPVLVRTQDDSLLSSFQKAGATEVIPEALEGSLMLVSHVLTLLDLPHEEIELQINQARSERYKLLHGFLQGSSPDKTPKRSEPGIKRQAITISESAYACGKRVGDFDLAVEFSQLKRADSEIDYPEAHELLQAGDLLILTGTPEALEAAEDRLLIG